jgi:hypothetical protein
MVCRQHGFACYYIVYCITERFVLFFIVNRQLYYGDFLHVGHEFVSCS